MATLHLISSLFSHSSEQWQQLQAVLLPDDAVLLLGQALYNFATWPHVAHACYVLQSDIAATGFQPTHPVTVIDYDGFVALGVRYERNLSW